MKKRIIIAMIFILLLVNRVFAAKYVATVDGKSYTSMQTALNKMKSDQTLTMLVDINTKSTLKVTGNKRININFAGNRYQYSGKGKAFEINGSNVTIRNMKLQSKNYAFSVNKGAVLTISNGNSKGYIINRGTLVIDGGTYSSTGCIASKKDELIQNYGKLTINGGKITGITDNALFCLGGKTEINGGEFRCDAPYDNGYYYSTVSLRKGAVLTINDGSFKGKGNAVQNTKGKVVINNGFFRSTKSNAISNDGGNMIINGGKYTAGGKKYYTIYNKNGDLIINYAIIKGIVGNECSEKKELRINDGVFTGVNDYPAVANMSGKMIISGGKYSTQKHNAVYNDKKGKIYISGGEFKSTNGYYAIWNVGKAVLSGGKFITKGGNGHSIGCVSGSTLTKNGDVEGIVDYK